MSEQKPWLIINKFKENSLTIDFPKTIITHTRTHIVCRSFGHSPCTIKPKMAHYFHFHHEHVYGSKCQLYNSQTYTSLIQELVSGTFQQDTNEMWIYNHQKWINAIVSRHSLHIICIKLLGVSVFYSDSWNAKRNVIYHCVINKLSCQRWYSCFKSPTPNRKSERKKQHTANNKNGEYEETWILMRIDYLVSKTV